MGKSVVEELIVINLLPSSQNSTLTVAKLIVELELLSTVPFTIVKSGI
ncbi:MAG TPA: hypothetical protein VE130_11545 [Nitrososphaeraceae archaeon]|nr:hypothetical protein [Nitrososphaeraceae archaeon]